MTHLQIYFEKAFFSDIKKLLAKVIYVHLTRMHNIVRVNFEVRIGPE